jgi:hypothetical protein
MSLYTDSDHVTAADLRAIDYEVGDVAETHHLTLEGVGSICRGAWEECADRILAQFPQFGSALNDINTLPDYPAGTTRSSVRLAQIVASDEQAEKNSPLKSWMIYVALEGLYRAVGNASQEDRYKKKQEAYRLEAARAWRTLSQRGLPVVSQPLDAPGAIHVRGSGEFRDSDVSSTASGTRVEQTVEVAVAYWDATRGVESGPSRIVGFVIPENSLLVVSRARCVPPAGVTHWNIYVSTAAGEPLSRQAQVAIASSSWTAPAAIAATATQLGAGQAAERNLAFVNMLQRC